MGELADAGRKLGSGHIDSKSYQGLLDDIEERYAGRIFRDDCRTYDTAEEYHGFLTLLQKLAPEKTCDLDWSFEHEHEHAQAVEGMKGVKVAYGVWLLRENDGKISAYPCVQLETEINHYDQARQRSLNAAREPSPLDQKELGQNKRQTP